MRTRCTGGAYTGNVPRTLHNLEATASSWEPKDVHNMHVRLFFACAMSFVMFPCWQACNLLSCSLWLHRLHVSQGGLASCHNSSPSNRHQGTKGPVFTRASKVGQEKAFKYLTWCANSPQQEKQTRK